MYHIPLCTVFLGFVSYTLPFGPLPLTTGAPVTRPQYGAGYVSMLFLFALESLTLQRLCSHFEVSPPWSCDSHVHQKHAKRSYKGSYKRTHKQLGKTCRQVQREFLSPHWRDGQGQETVHWDQPESSYRAEERACCDGPPPPLAQAQSCLSTGTWCGRCFSDHSLAERDCVPIVEGNRGCVMFGMSPPAHNNIMLGTANHCCLF